MKILAEKEGGNVYLLVEDGVDELDGETEARVLDNEYEKLYPWQYAHSIVARGYWGDYDGDADLDAMLNDAEEVTY